MWPLQWITKQDFITHVKETIEKYDNKLESFDLKKFNRNVIDPIKLIFDKLVYASTWDEIIKNEIFRQRDKSNNNDIGYFHQNIFNYIKGCTVPDTVWDVIVELDNEIIIPGSKSVKTVFVEIKNKHNTMNYSSAGKTLMRMQDKIIKNNNCACFLVEIIAKKSQNIPWATTLDGVKVSNKLIRRVSIDKFYEIVTGEKDAFFRMCEVLPEVIEEAIKDSSVNIPKDTVIDEIKSISKDKNISIMLAIYLLAFNTYNGFG